MSVGRLPERWGSQLAVAVIFAGLFLALLYYVVTHAEPPERRPVQPFVSNYSDQTLNDALAGDGLDRRMAEIADAGSRDPREIGRVSGSPGFYETEKLILDTFGAIGLEIRTQEFRVAVPVTERCDILDETGTALPGIRLYPIEPSGLTLTALPEGGLSGRLVLAESSDPKYLAGCDPKDTIVLTYLDSAAGWSSLASLGFQALIVIEDEAEKTMRSSPDQAGAWGDLITSTCEVGYPRFVARGPLADHAGRDVAIQCRTQWEERKVRNVFGVLRADSPTPSEEALILTSHYDSSSVVPELAPGAEQAVPLATLLQMARALAPYRDTLKRDIIFVATAAHNQALAGISHFLWAIESEIKDRGLAPRFEQSRRDEEIKLRYAARALEYLQNDSLGTSGGKSGFPDLWAREDADFREWFERCARTVGGEINLDFKEQVLQRRLAFIRAGTPAYREGFDPVKAGDAERRNRANCHPLLIAFLEAQEMDARSGRIGSQPVAQLVECPEFREWRFRERLQEYVAEIETWHRQQIRELDDSIAVRDLLRRYRQTLTVGFELNSGGARQPKDLVVLAGVPDIGSSVGPQSLDLASLIQSEVPATNYRPEFTVTSWGPKDATATEDHPNRLWTDRFILESAAWTLCGRLALTVANDQFVSTKVGTPDDTFADIRTDAVRAQLPPLGRVLLAVAHGRMVFKNLPWDTRDRIVSVRGTVYTRAGTGSLTPDQPMRLRTFVRPRIHVPWGEDVRDMRGVRPFPVLKTNPYGEYRQPFSFQLAYPRWGGSAITVDAAGFDEQGRITYIKDESPSGQAYAKNNTCPQADLLAKLGQRAKPVNVVTFRSARVELFERSNPRTMKSFVAVNYLTKQGMAQPRSYRFLPLTAFLEPDLVFYLGLMDGAADNPAVQVYRAFMLNADPSEPVGWEEPDIFGRGYLAVDSGSIPYAHVDASESVLRTNEKRLRLQRAYGMADEQMINFHERGREWLDLARKSRSENDHVSAMLGAGKSLAYAINNHPVIRSKISQAIVGILWYLGLLVPFVFFFEKLLFAFTDIRKQLLASGLIFLVVFSLLRAFHPAFQMVRSSVMILLGFVVLLLTILVTLMVSGKFRQNIRDLRRREGRVEGADINRGGVIGTALMLGLNNMRRRKVRTGLTCITLVLLTFVMICFTSVSSDLINIEYATGRSSWNGIFLRNENYVPLTDPEVNAIRQSYGRQYPVTVHSWLSGYLTDETRIRNPEILIDREHEIQGTKVQKRARVSASIQMMWNEPMFSGIDKLMQNGSRWFPRGPVTRQERLAAQTGGYRDLNYVILPDNVARELDIPIESVISGAATVLVRDVEYTVLGIMDAGALSSVVGLDGRSILPYDLNAVQNLGVSASGQVLVPEDIKRLSGSDVIIVNRQPPAGRDRIATVSCGIMFPKEPYRLEPSGPTFPAVGFREQRRIAMEFLERLGEKAYYAVDGIAYWGSRKRAKTFEGLLELLIPIILAALTVFNTMRGSVYERKDEIYVYNAVGIAPNHVFFMFMAEASVYAVVGAMLGYLLSQMTGRVLMAAHLSGGMNLSYSSIETIYASLAIVLAVMLSTIVPARNAAKLASPSGRKTWTMPEAKDDVMSFSLPFTFTPHDRIAVISYFHRWLDANGEGSSGPFFSTRPESALLKSPGETRSGGLVPGIRSTIWLKPYDLGVSQRMEIWLPTDPETGEYVANVRLTRLSGTSAAWERAVKPFLGVLRKQFLNWRAATPGERSEMFAEAREFLRGAMEKEPAHG